MSDAELEFWLMKIGADGLVRIERDTLTVTDPEALERRAER